MIHEWWGQTPSSMGAYLQCPRKFKGMYIDKSMPYVGSEAQEKGKRMHSAAEDYLMRQIDMPGEWAYLKPAFDQFLAWPGQMMVERPVSVDANWMTTGWRTKELGSKVDFMKYDKAAGYLRLLDFKTGKPNENYLQLEIGAAVMFAREPTLRKVNAAYVYTKFQPHEAKFISKLVFTRAQYPELKDKIQKRIIRMKQAFDTDDFQPIPTALCGWCNHPTCEFREG